MRPRSLPDGHEAFVADALLDAMLDRDVARVRAVGAIAAELVALDAERARRERSRRPSTSPRSNLADENPLYLHNNDASREASHPRNPASRK